MALIEALEEAAADADAALAYAEAALLAAVAAHSTALDNQRRISAALAAMSGTADSTPSPAPAPLPPLPPPPPRPAPAGQTCGACGGTMYEGYKQVNGRTLRVFTCTDSHCNNEQYV